MTIQTNEKKNTLMRMKYFEIILLRIYCYKHQRWDFDPTEA